MRSQLRKLTAIPNKQLIPTCIAIKKSYISGYQFSLHNTCGNANHLKIELITLDSVFFEGDINGNIKSKKC